MSLPSHERLMLTDASYKAGYATASAETKAELDRLRAINAKLLSALEGLNPGLIGKGAKGEAYWHVIHLHPFHSFNAECPWCQRAEAVEEAEK